MLCNWIIRRNNLATKYTFILQNTSLGVTTTYSTYRQVPFSNIRIGDTSLLGTTSIMRSIEQKHLRWYQSIYTSTEMNSVLTILLYASISSHLGQEFGIGLSFILLQSRKCQVSGSSSLESMTCLYLALLYCIICISCPGSLSLASCLTRCISALSAATLSNVCLSMPSFRIWSIVFVV